MLVPIHLPDGEENCMPSFSSRLDLSSTSYTSARYYHQQPQRGETGGMSILNHKFPRDTLRSGYGLGWRK